MCYCALLVWLLAIVRYLKLASVDIESTTTLIAAYDLVTVQVVNNAGQIAQFRKAAR